MNPAAPVTTYLIAPPSHTTRACPTRYSRSRSATTGVYLPSGYVQSTLPLRASSANVRSSSVEK